MRVFSFLMGMVLGAVALALVAWFSMVRWGSKTF